MTYLTSYKSPRILTHRGRNRRGKRVFNPPRESNDQRDHTIREQRYEARIGLPPISDAKILAGDDWDLAHDRLLQMFESHNVDDIVQKANAHRRKCLHRILDRATINARLEQALKRVAKENGETVTDLQRSINAKRFAAALGPLSTAAIRARNTCEKREQKKKMACLGRSGSGYASSSSPKISAALLKPIHHAVMRVSKSGDAYKSPKLVSAPVLSSLCKQELTTPAPGQMSATKTEDAICTVQSSPFVAIKQEPNMFFSTESTSNSVGGQTTTSDNEVPYVPLKRPRRRTPSKANLARLRLSWNQSSRTPDFVRDLLAYKVKQDTATAEGR